MVLFGWLPQSRPRGGPRRRWRDVLRKDLKEIGISEAKWYEKTQDRASWRYQCKPDDSDDDDDKRPQQQPQTDPQLNRVMCTVCHRSFRRESDKKRHKCLDERSKPISEQKGAVQCSSCLRWFASKGGFSVHRCPGQ